MLLDIKCGFLEIGFAAETGGFPAKVTVNESDGRKTVLFNNQSNKLTVELENGHILHPAATPENINVYEDKYGTYVNFFNVNFVDEQGNNYPRHYLTLRHEFYPDGTAFTNMFFFVQDIHTPGITRFEVAACPDFSTFDNVRWSNRKRPENVDGTLITSQTERFLKAGENCKFSQIIPLMSFNASRKFAPSMYAEFFVEGQSTLSNRPSDGTTEICWRGNSPELRWNLQNGAFPRPLVNQLRNQWGWVIRPAQKERHLPPMKMYHYFDNYLRYPADEITSAVIAAKCDILIMHENWRSDTQNDGVPFDFPSFIKLRNALHAAGIRLAVYLRGNEESVVSRQAAWFRQLLQYNFDGLYMDYGGPFNRFAPPDESYCGGRVLFRDHYLAMRNIRETVGEDGLFFNHTGPSFSAVGQGFTTGYVSGEGERGMLIKGREEYEYFSMSTVTAGTLWAAAFPEYSSPRIIPFIASSGQYPHCNLGEQFLSSSLVHPPVPGISDHAFDHIWRLWSIFRREKDLTVINDYNSSRIFPQDIDTGHYLAIAKSGNTGLLLLSNFSESKRQVNSTFDLKGAGFKLENFKISLLSQGRVLAIDGLPEKVDIEGYGVAGILLTANELSLHIVLEDYLRPEAELSDAGKKYLERVARQKMLRENPPQWKETYLRIIMPELSPTPYEDSMTLDLFNNSFEIGEVMPNGEFKSLCFIDLQGKSGSDCEEQRIFSGQSSPAIRLNDFGLTGLKHLAVRSSHGDMLFYSFCILKLSSSPEGSADSYQLEFLNDIEPDRAFINFSCYLN